MAYLVEINVARDDCDDKYRALQKFATQLTSSGLIGEGVEHDSSHYIEDTYFLWEVENIEIKLYWCDEPERENILSLGLVSYEQDVQVLGNKVRDYIKGLNFSITSFEQYEE